MAERQIKEFKFPMRGLLETSSYGADFEDFSLDLLNVVPINPRDEELKGASRAGTARAIGQPVESAILPVQRMIQVTLSNDEAISDLSFSDPFADVGSGENGNGFGGGWLRPEPSYNGVPDWPDHDSLLGE